MAKDVFNERPKDLKLKKYKHGELGESEDAQSNGSLGKLPSSDFEPICDAAKKGSGGSVDKSLVGKVKGGLPA